ncbi:MAG: inorganic phosphate transporter [Thermoprotei archaeon]|nr:MAG: inorganic phosphate transporter [Thermoprotei archaeon]
MPSGVGYLWLYIGIVLAFSLAWINGANNAGNAIGLAVGARALSIRRALWLAAVFDFLGAILFGHFVSMTLLKGIVDTSRIESAYIVVAGMIAALFATALWVLIATLIRVPMSISPAIVGGITGFGLTVAGVSSVNWGRLAEIVASWIYLPFLSIAVSIALYRLYRVLTKRLTGTRLLLLAAVFFYVVVFTTAFLLSIKTLRSQDVAVATGYSLTASTALTLLFALYLSKRAPRSLAGARNYVFRVLLVSSCAAMAFSHGANDVAYSAGPLAGILYAVGKGFVPETVTIPLEALVLSAMGIASGILVWGYSVVETIGEKITTLTAETAFIAQFGASLTTLFVTRMGLPVSTTLAVVGAIAGVGFARGIRSVNLRTLAKITAMWFLGFPVVAGITALITQAVV